MYGRDFSVSSEVADMLAGRLRAGGLSVGGEPLRSSGRGKLQAKSRTPSPKQQSSPKGDVAAEDDDEKTLYSESTTSRKSLLGKFSKG